jgi:histidinol-phosphate aminotransferase
MIDATRISRRNLLHTLGAATAGVAVRSLAAPPLASAAEQTAPTSPSNPILLDHNENAYGPSEKVIAAMREAASSGNRYPRAEYDVLTAKIATLHSVKPDQVQLGCGSTEILRMAAVALLQPGKKFVQASPTFPALGRFAKGTGAEIIEVPLNKMHEHDVEAMLARSGTSPALLYICNPNNPTATLTPRKSIESLLHKLSPDSIVLIDEAYHDFVSPNASYASFLDHPIDDHRVIVCRTFSKVYGLAGMRIGYAIGAPDLMKKLSASQMRASVSMVATKAAIAALDDTDYVRMAIKRNANDRQDFLNQVNGRMLRPLDSHTNFVLLNPMRSPDLVIDHLKKHDVLIAPRFPAMDKYVRISLGTTTEMQEFWRVFDLLPPAEKMAM